MASDTTPDTESQQHSSKVSAHVIHHSIVPASTTGTGVKSKNKPKEKKETKTKEFSHLFESSEANYVAVLKAILVKHGEDKYNITEKMTYSIKVQLPGVKKGDAVDIDCFDEYTDLAADILEGLPPKMTIFVDMADIQRRWSGRGFNRGSDDEDVHGDNPSLYDSNGLSDLERELARLRMKLEKEYQNDHDAGYTYIDPNTGEACPLTPQMMKEWCRAMYDGQATVKEAPGFIRSFDPAKRQVALHPARIAAGVNKSRGSATGDGVADVVGHLATMVTALVGGGVAGLGARQAQLPSTPTKAPVGLAVVGSPVIPSPTKLPRFLDHCEKSLGIVGARRYEFAMKQEGYGPDILHLVEDRELVGLGMKKGDVLRIKAGSQPWWNGPNAKRKRGDSDAMPTADPLATPPAKKVAFERRFPEGGSERFYGPRIAAGDGEKNIFYCCPLRSKFVAVPLGYRYTEEDEYVSDEEDFDSLDLWGAGEDAVGQEAAARALVTLHKA
ncbi:hypothetical protein B0H17DRAFT_1204353 [Mycena rosella]|uniref:Uncharacterized protein n=1 Tax=Mycena rosella TaxID=1033263 RepID=A0AAD7GBB3_MYCRO|nr:hypothetical protein B0H17DRAFT_1204353 [Mycena rosella]